MNKLLTFLLFSFISLNASNLLYLEQDNNRGVITYCIDDDYYYRGNRLYFYDLKANYERTINTKSFQKITVIGGWSLDQYNNCEFKEEDYYGLSYEQYHYLMAMYGIFLSSLIALALIMAV